MFPTTPPGSALVISLSVVPTQGTMPLGSPDFPPPPGPSSLPALESRLSYPGVFDKMASRMLPVCRPNRGLQDQRLRSLILPPPFPQLGVRPTAPCSCCLSFEILSWHLPLSASNYCYLGIHPFACLGLKSLHVDLHLCYLWFVPTPSTMAGTDTVS